MLEFVVTSGICTSFVLMGMGLESSDSLYETAVHWYYASVWLFIIVFAVGSINAVYYFVRNLSKIVRHRANTLRDVTSVKKDDIPLDTAQQKLIDLSARYVLLFFISIFSFIRNEV